MHNFYWTEITFLRVDQKKLKGSILNCLIQVIQWTLELQYTGLDKIQRLIVLCLSVSQEKWTKYKTYQRCDFLLKHYFVFSYSQVFQPILMQDLSEIFSKLDMNTWTCLDWIHPVCYSVFCVLQLLVPVITKTQVCPIL